MTFAKRLEKTLCEIKVETVGARVQAEEVTRFPHNHSLDYYSCKNIFDIITDYYF